MQLRSILIFAVTVLAASLACAEEYKLKDLRIADPFARATMPRQPTGVAYLTIENKGKNGDKLIAASSPAAKSVEIHNMWMEGEVMKMREVPGIELKPASKVVMTPGDGYHLMLMGLRQTLKPGDKFPMTLTFEKAGKTEVTVVVRDRKEMQESAAHHGHESK